MYSTSYGLSLYRNLSCHSNKTMDIRAICSQAWKFLLNTKFDFYNRAKHCIQFSKSYLSPQYVHLQNTLLKRSRPQCIINTKIKKVEIMCTSAFVIVVGVQHLLESSLFFHVFIYFLPFFLLPLYGILFHFQQFTFFTLICNFQFLT